jgi:hypothetical protein
VRPQPHVKARRTARQARLRALGYSNYADYLRSAHWKQTKAHYRASDLPQECICGEPDVHLHHMTYDRIGAEKLTDLTPLCPNCHTLIHILEFRGDVSLDFVGFFDEGRAVEGRAALAQFAEQQRQDSAARLRAQQDEVLALSFASRLMRARDHARFKRRVDISHRVHVLKLMIHRGKSNEALTRQLMRIEETAYGWDGWQDAA